jgi:alpha-N-arabinofuranosidase
MTEPIRLALGAATSPLAVDVTARAEPISPYIFGQFIEHLGRCIYGGIWAEMLEDRKFFYPVTTEYQPYEKLDRADFPVVRASPWQIIGAPGGVTMEEEAAFVGRHSPKILHGSGIRQRDLGVVEARACTGYIWAKPVADRAKVEVRLLWGDDAHECAFTTLDVEGNKFVRIPFSLTSRRTTARGAALELHSVGGDVVLGTVSLMPADNVRGLRLDTLTLLKELRATSYRWPGGNFVSGYDWRDGIGDRDRRPPRRNLAWTGVEHNDFGTDEFIDLCREIDAEPMIAVNTGLGDAYSAAQWVEYCNKDAKTVAGGWRAKNGHVEPYGVRHWFVGNEMFGTWQLGFMQLAHYTVKHNQVAEAMWMIDPELSLVATGDLETINKGHDPEQAKRGIGWSEGMLTACAERMTLLSEHFYQGRVPWTDTGRASVDEHVTQLKRAIRARAQGHLELQARLPNLAGRRIPIAIDEWNYWHREVAYGELGCVYELVDALGVAIGLHEFFRNTDTIRMAHYAQTVNVLGAIKTTTITAELEGTGLVLQLYRERFGTHPLALAADFDPCDVVAALTQDGKALTVGVVNPKNDVQHLHLDMVVEGAAEAWIVSGATPGAHNAPGKPREIELRHTAGLPAGESWPVPALACAVFHVPLTSG